MTTTINASNSGSGGLIQTADASGILALQTAGVTAVTVDASQNVGIGTTSPGANLDVQASTGPQVRIKPVTGTSYGFLSIGNTGGNFNIGRESSGGGSLLTGSTGYASILNSFGAYPMQFATNGSLAMTISSGGIVTMNAYGVGTATFSASGVISSVSDETWKIKDGVPVDVDSMLKKLKPGYWYYNDAKKETFGTDRQLGFYAQNVNAAIGPEAAPTPEEGKPWGYYDRSVLAVTVMSLQKALATIESLTARIAALEGAPT